MGRLQIFTVYYYHVTTPYICFVGSFFFFTNLLEML